MTVDKATLALILNAVFDAAEELLKGKPVPLYLVKAARMILMPLLSKLTPAVAQALPKGTFVKPKRR
jgi:hypothetical protein